MRATPVTSPPALQAAAGALAREKSLFLARNAESCKQLLVRLECAEDTGALVIQAAFTLDESRTWHSVAVSVTEVELLAGSGPDRGLIAAFGQLDDGIGAAKIARLFAPLTVAQRMAAGRN